MSSYHGTRVEYGRTRSPEYGFSDPRVHSHGHYDEYGQDATRTALTIVHPAPSHHPAAHHPSAHHPSTHHPSAHHLSGHHRDHSPVIQEPVIEHEHHHLHHHIDHGDISGRQVATGRTSRPNLGREYSYDDLDVRERRYHNGNAVTSVSLSHDHGHAQGRSHRHRRRHRSRNGEVESVTRYSRSDIDLRLDGEDDNLTIVDVPHGTRRLFVNIDKGQSRREQSVDWRRERGIRRSRGLGNELWTEITKDLITREAIEECGYQFEETDFFYYIFEYLDRGQIRELRDLTEDIRRERVHDLEYNSIAGGSQYGHEHRSHTHPHHDGRTEIIIEDARGGHSGHGRRRY